MDLGKRKHAWALRLMQGGRAGGSWVWGAGARTGEPFDRLWAEGGLAIDRRELIEVSAGVPGLTLL